MNYYLNYFDYNDCLFGQKSCWSRLAKLSVEIGVLGFGHFLLFYIKVKAKYSFTEVRGILL